MINLHFGITRITILQHTSKSLTIWSQVSTAREDTKKVELENRKEKPAAFIADFQLEYLKNSERIL